MLDLRIPDRWAWPLAALMVLAIYLVCVSDLPTELPASAYDDDLFIKQARMIGKGFWLGDGYNQFTLIKGPFHSIQIWLASIIGIPVGFWFRFLYALACMLFCSLALARSGHWIRFSALICLLFDPWINTTYGGLRLLREATYIPFELTALTFSLASLDCFRRRVADSRQAFSKRFWLYLSLAGVSFGVLLITREARVVVLCAAFLFILMLGGAVLRSRFFSGRHWLQLAAVTLCMLICVGTPLSIVRVANGYHYGLALSNEFEEGAFKGFYQDLISVKIPGESSKPWVPINQSTLETLYRLAPDTVLGKTIDHLNPGWKQPGCSLRKDVCDEYAGGWFMWAWRSALFQSFSPDSPEQFQTLVRQSHQDLAQVCNNYPEQLDCRQSASGYLPWPSRWGEPGGSFRAFSGALSKQVNSLIDVNQGRSAFRYGPTTDQLKLARRMGVLLPPRDSSKLRSLEARIQSLRFAGSLLRWLMLLAASIFMLMHWRQLRRIVVDPGFWLLAVFAGLQLLVLVLIQVSSFESTLYLTMVSPLLTMLVWRMMAVLIPPAAPSKPVALS